MFVKVAEQHQNFARSIQVLVAHDGAIVEPAPEAIFDTSGETPSESPEQAAFARKTSPEGSTLAEQKPGTSQDERKVGQMLQDGNGKDAVVTPGSAGTPRRSE